jgi:hypothetical protein
MVKLFQNKIYKLRSDLFYLISDSVPKLLLNLNLKFLCNLQVFIFLSNLIFILFLYWSNKNYLAAEIALLKPQPVLNVLPVHIPINLNPEVLSSASSFWEQYGPAIMGISCVVVAGVALYIFLSSGNPGDCPVIPDTQEILNSNAEKIISLKLDLDSVKLDVGKLVETVGSHSNAHIQAKRVTDCLADLGNAHELKIDILSTSVLNTEGYIRRTADRAANEQSIDRFLAFLLDRGDLI